MTAYAVTDTQNNLVSIGTIVASPLPAGLTATPISDADYTALRDGWTRWNQGVLVPTGKPTPEQEATRVVNTADLEAKLALLISEAAAATALLQAQRDTANLATGTLTTAVLSTAARQLQAAVKEQAMLQQAHIKRTVAIARLLSGALDETSGT